MTVIPMVRWHNPGGCMTNNVDVSEMQGPLGELFRQCSGANGRGRFDEFKLWLKKVSALLTLLQTIAVSSVQRFVVKDHFTKDNKKVKFWDFGDNFTIHFGNRIENNIGLATIAVSRLERRAKDPEIKAELAGETKRVFTISLAHFYQMIEAQGQGQPGPLLVNGYANIAYIDGMDNWAVSASWYAGDGWGVLASPVDRPIPWYDENQVLSRKSVGI